MPLFLSSLFLSFPLLFHSSSRPFLSFFSFLPLSPLYSAIHLSLSFSLASPFSSSSYSFTLISHANHTPLGGRLPRKFTAVLIPRGAEVLSETKAQGRLESAKKRGFFFFFFFFASVSDATVSNILTRIERLPVVISVGRQRDRQDLRRISGYCWYLVFFYNKGCKVRNGRDIRFFNFSNSFFFFCNYLDMSVRFISWYEEQRVYWCNWRI